MGWGISFEEDVYISKKHFNSVFELDDEIEELRDSLVQREKEILMYVSGRPSDFIPVDWEEDGVTFLKNRVEEAFEFYRDDYNLLLKLLSFKEFLEKNPQKNVKDFR